MSKQLVNPMQALIKKASQTLPAATGHVAAQQARIDRRKGGVVILADVSASMSGIAWGAQRKIDILRESVTAARQFAPAKLIAFSKSAREVESIPEPESHTDLEAGLRAAQALDPGTTLLISDGQPDDAEAALAIARTFRGAIDVLYIGPETDAAAMKFMQRLADAAGGNSRVNDIGNREGSTRLLSHITALLPAPK